MNRPGFCRDSGVCVFAQGKVDHPTGLLYGKQAAAGEDCRVGNLLGKNLDRSWGSVAAMVTSVHRMGSRSMSATGSAQCGHGPPGPTRRQKTPQSAHRCSPRKRASHDGHS